MSRTWTREELLRAAVEQSSRDCGCLPEDFFKEENTVLSPLDRDGAKKDVYKRQAVWLPFFCCRQVE